MRLFSRKIDSHDGWRKREGAVVNYSDLSTQELILVCCGSRDEDAWHEFIRRYGRLVCSVVLKTCMGWGEYSRELVEDLVQETYLKLCAHESRLLRAFQNTDELDTFPAYLKVITANVVHDHCRTQRAMKRKPLALASIEDVDAVAFDPNHQRRNSPERQVLLREIDEALSRVCNGPTGERDRMIFMLYFRVGMTAKAIGELPTISLNVKAIESALFRLTQALRQQLNERPQEGFSVEASLEQERRHGESQ